MSVVGQRISMDLVATRLRTTAATLGVACTVATCLDPQYVNLFAQAWPYIWVYAQRTLPRDNGEGLTEFARQNMNTQFLIRPVIQRYPPGTVATADVRMALLENVVTQALFGWKPAGARVPFAFSSIVDGPTYEAASVLDMIVATQTTYSGSNP